MLIYLKIKIKSLAAEAQIIRKEERKWPGTTAERHGLHSHRVLDVRREARSALLAYGYLRGRKYLQLEPKCSEAPNWRRIGKLVERYGEPGVVKGLDGWKQ